MTFEDRVAVVTGGAAGIGRAVCLAFARGGARVVAVDRDQGEAEATAALCRGAGVGAIAVAADVTRAADVAAYVARAVGAYGRIDCFFNNAGIEGRVALVAEADDDMFDAVLAVNVRGVYLGLKHVIPAMIERGGAIVNTSSVAGINGSPGLSAYSASKHAVIGLTRTVALEYAARGVRVNAICPGPVQTRMIQSLEQQFGTGGSDPGARLRGTIPTGRYATVEEIADLVLFLCSDAAASITGGQYVIDGGRTAGPNPAASRASG